MEPVKVLFADYDTLFFDVLTASKPNRKGRKQPSILAKHGLSEERGFNLKVMEYPALHNDGIEAVVGKVSVGIKWEDSEKLDKLRKDTGYNIEIYNEYGLQGIKIGMPQPKQVLDKILVDDPDCLVIEPLGAGFRDGPYDGFLDLLSKEQAKREILIYTLIHDKSDFIKRDLPYLNKPSLPSAISRAVYGLLGIKYEGKSEVGELTDLNQTARAGRKPITPFARTSICSLVETQSSDLLGYHNRVKEVLDVAFERLNDRERQVTMLRSGIYTGLVDQIKERLGIDYETLQNKYKHGMTQELIGDFFGVSGSRIEQNEKSAAKKITNPTRVRKIIEYAHTS